ncbi:MAG: biotin/lipoyl-binding protein [Bacteroidaceae bacterium]|nr:biotin/lipoyl-binding protein [Bacteroidaceae bacterium]
MEHKIQKANIIMALSSLAVIVVIICVVGIFTFNREEDNIIQGQAEASEYRISSKVPGRILEIRVTEGQKVNAGDTLAILEAPDIQAKLAQAEAVRTAATAQNAKAQKGAREEEIQATYEIWQKAKAGLEIMEKSYRRVENLFSQGVVSEQKRDEAKAQYDAAAATEKAALAQYTMAKNGAENETKAMAAAQMRQAEGVVAEVNSYIDETVLTASIAGEVSEIFPMVGELVGTGAPIMNIAVTDKMWASFNVREDLLKDMAIESVQKAYVPALDKDIDIKITYIRDIGSYAAWKATKANGQYDLKTFEVRAVPTEKVQGLRPGMTVLMNK